MAKVRKIEYTKQKFHLVSTLYTNTFFKKRTFFNYCCTSIL